MRGSRDFFFGGAFGGRDAFVYHSPASAEAGPGRLSADISDALSWPTSLSDALSWPATLADALSWPADISEAAGLSTGDALTLASLDPMADRLSILPNTLDYWW